MNYLMKMGAFAVMATLTAIACRPRPDVTPSPTPATVHAKQLFSGLRTSAETFTVTAGTTRTIVGAKGTGIRFYPNSFKDAAGNTITSGTINIELTEMLKPGDMIANFTTTTDDGNMLRSGGQVYIKATMNGNEVFANKYGLAYKQEQDRGPMSLYYGDANNRDSMVNWKESEANVGTRADTLIRVKDTGFVNPSLWQLSSGLYYIFDSCTKFNFINCDAFYASTAPRTDFTITLPAAFTIKNTRVYVVVASVNGAMSAYFADTSSSKCVANYIPIGETLKIVAMAKIDNEYYYYESASTTLTKNMVLPAAPAKQSESYVKAKLAAL